MSRLALLLALVLLALVVVAGTGAVIAATALGPLDGDDVSIVEELRTDTDPLDADTDDDGLDDGVERAEYDTDPTVADTDGDGLADGEEVDDYESDPLAADSDDDGLADGLEVDVHGTDPTAADSDGDGLTDRQEVEDLPTAPTAADTDGDGFDDRREVSETGTDPVEADTDGDGLDDGAEGNDHGTDPLDADTDADGLVDGDEVHERGTDPTVADTDGDGLDDGEEVTEFRTDPLDVDTDGDGLDDGIEAATDGPLADADPRRMDIFVELDYMARERPDDRAIELVREAYADAPVENPDGTTGIDLHVVVDDRVPREERTNPLDLTRLVGTHFDRPGYGYHYAIVVNDARRLGGDIGGYAAFGVMAFQTGSPGVGEANDAYFVGSQAQLFMHELGHSAGLVGDDFEGIDSRAYSHEEYPSVMNYNAWPGFVGYNSGEPFDDWQHLVDGLHTPETDNAATAE